MPASVAAVWVAVVAAALLASAALDARADEVATATATATSSVGAAANVKLPPPGVDASLRREQIAAQQAALKAVLAQREADCANHFAVVICLQGARSEQRDERERLSAEEQGYNAAQRTSDAARRRQSLSEKAAALALRVDTGAAPSTPAAEPSAELDASAAVSATATATATVPALAIATTAAPTVLPKRSKAVRSVSRAALEAQHLANFEARKRSAQAHLLDVTQRNAARAAEGRQMAPLPDLSDARPTGAALRP